MKEPNYALFPLPRGVRVIMDYIDYGKDPGTFRPVVENDLITCMTSNPEEWLPCLQSLVLWFYTEAPAHCIGSKEKVKHWQAHGGKKGKRGWLKSIRKPYSIQACFQPMETD